MTKAMCGKTMENLKNKINRINLKLVNNKKAI